MATPYEQMKAAWESSDRAGELNRVVEALAAEGIALEQLNEALIRLLLKIREAGADDDTEEIINEAGDRLHGWCHPKWHIKTRSSSDHRA